MKKKEKKSQKKSSKNVKKKFKQLKLPSNNILLPGFANIRLRLHVRDDLFDYKYCIELQKVLNVDADLNAPQYSITSTFHRYHWDLKISDINDFKRRLVKHQKKNPNVDIYCEDISIYRPLIQYIGYGAGLISLLSKLLL